MRVFSRTLGGEARYHHRCGSVLLQLLEVGSPTAIMAYICRQRDCITLAQEALHRFTVYQGNGPYTERDRNARATKLPNSLAGNSQTSTSMALPCFTGLHMHQPGTMGRSARQGVKFIVGRGCGAATHRPPRPRQFSIQRQAGHMRPANSHLYPARIAGSPPMSMMKRLVNAFPAKPLLSEGIAVAPRGSA